MEIKNLAEKLKELRILKGMSQEYLAEESRVSLRTIQRIENNESKPTGETIKRIAIGLDVEITKLIDTTPIDETGDLKATIFFLKKKLSKATNKSEIKTFETFINLLQNIKEKNLDATQKEGIESYIAYLELDKIPSFSNDIFKQKLKKFKKYLKTKLRFVQSNFYTQMATSFTISFLIAMFATNTIKIEMVSIGLLFIGFFVWMDVRIKNQGRDLKF